MFWKDRKRKRDGWRKRDGHIFLRRDSATMQRLLERYPTQDHEEQTESLICAPLGYPNDQESDHLALAENQ